MALEIMKDDKDKNKKGETVKAELTTSPGISVLQPTINVKSGTKNSTVKTVVKPSKVKAMRKKDLTAEEYFNPPAPTYSSGDIGLSLLSNVPNIEKLPFVGDKLKKAIDEQGQKPGNIYLDVLAKVLSKNPSLIDAPFIGDYIKDMAYKTSSTGSGTIKTGKSINAADMQTTDGAMDFKNYRNRLDLLRQYIYGDQNLPQAAFTPSDDYYKFLPTYSLRNKLGDTRLDKNLTDIVSAANRPIENTVENPGLKDSFVGVRNYNKKRYQGLLSDLDNVIKTGKPVFYSGTDNNEKNVPLKIFYDNIPDLGHYKSGFAVDKELGLPYAFVADAWDFYPVDYEKYWNQDADPNNPDKFNENQYSTSAYQQSYLMHKAGKPYKIYERTYIDPKTKKVIPQKQILKMKHKLK